MSNELRVVLVGVAKDAHDRMLDEVRADGKTSINSSRMINWIVSDYFSRVFRKRKDALCKAHFNERKCLMEAMKIEDPEERRRALHEAARSLGTKRPAKAKESKAPQNALADSKDNG